MSEDRALKDKESHWNLMVKLFSCLFSIYFFCMLFFSYLFLTLSLSSPSITSISLRLVSHGNSKHCMCDRVNYKSPGGPKPKKKRNHSVSQKQKARFPIPHSIGRTVARTDLEGKGKPVLDLSKTFARSARCPLHVAYR
jgi:hypothetical protein